MNRSKTLSSSRKQKNATKTKRRNIKESSIPLKSIYVDVSNSNISSFRFLNRLQKVLSVNATNTLISDFSGAPLCSTLRQIKIQGSPISKNPNYRLMILIMLCPDIEYIDNEKVTKKEKEKSLSMQFCVQPKLYEGFILTSADPATLSRADETIVINPDDIKESKGKNSNEIKFDQTIEMMEKLSFEISNASDELGVGHIPKLPIRELLKKNKFDASDFLATNSKTAFVNTKKDKQSTFVKAFKEYTQTPEDLIQSSILLDSPEKREERHSMIIQDSPSKISKESQNHYDDQSLGQQVLSDDQLDSQNYQNEEEDIDQASVEKLYEDIVEQSIPNKADVTVEKIFDIASEIMASPEKPSRYFEDNASTSSDVSTSLLQKNKNGNENSKIPIRFDSPSKKYGQGLAASQLTQTKFGGYRKISDTESIPSDYDLSFNEEEEFQLTATEDEAKIEYSGFEEEEIQSNNQIQEEESELETSSKDMSNQVWVILSETENKELNEQVQNPETTEQQPNEGEEIQEEEELAQPSKDMHDPDWVITSETESRAAGEQEQVQPPETAEEPPAANEEITNQDINIDQSHEEEEQAPPSKDMPNPDWVIISDAENKADSEEHLAEGEEIINQGEISDQPQGEQEPVPPSKDMPDPDWVIQEEAESNATTEQEQTQPIETTEQQSIIDQEITNQEENVDQPQEEQEPIPPSKDMPDPDWVVSEEQEQIKPAEAEEEKPTFGEETGNQDEIINQPQEEQEPVPPSKDMPDPDWVIQEEAESNATTEQEQTQPIETTEQQSIIDQEITNQEENVDQPQEKQEPIPPSKDMPDPDWVVAEDAENKAVNEKQQPIEGETANQEEEQEPVPPSKDMPDPNWVISDEAENNSATQQQPAAIEEIKKQEEITNQEENIADQPQEEPVPPPSKDMPDPDWVVASDVENKEMDEQIQDELNSNQETEQNGLNISNTQNRNIEKDEEEQAPPSKDMPDPDWVISSDVENKFTNDQEQPQEKTETIETNEQPTEDQETNIIQPQEQQEPVPPSKDMPDPDWVVSPDKENKAIEQEQNQPAETTEQQPSASQGECIDQPQEEQEQVPPSKDMPDPDWVVAEDGQNNSTTEQEQPSASQENIINQPQDEQEQVPPSKEMPDPDWVVAEDAENKAVTEQEQAPTNEAITNQEENIDQPQEEQESIPPSKDMPDPDWVVAEDAENNATIEQEQPAENQEENIIDQPQKEQEPAPPSKDMPDPDWVVAEETEKNATTEQEQAQLTETTEQQPIIDQEITNKEESIIDQPQEEQESIPPSKDMPDPDWVVAEDAENNATIEQEQPAENQEENIIDQPQEEQEPAPPSKDMPDPDWVVAEDVENNATTEQEQAQPTETTEQQPAENQEENIIDQPQEEQEPAPPSKDMPDPDWVIPEDGINVQPEENQPAERDVQIEQNEENSHETEGDNYDPEVIAILDQQVQPRETVQIDELPSPENPPQEGSNQQEIVEQEAPSKETGNEEPSKDPSWVLNENETENQHQKQEEEKTENLFQVDSPEINQNESTPKEESNNEEPSIDPSWVIKSDNEQQEVEPHPFEVSDETKNEVDSNAQPPWAT